MGPALLDKMQSVETTAQDHNVLVAREMENLEAELDDFLCNAHEVYRGEAASIRAANKQEALYGDEHIEELWRQNNALGYQQEYVERERAGASRLELQPLAEARLRNVKTGFLEALNAMDVEVPEEMLYDVDDTGRVNDGGMYIDAMYLRSLTPANGDIELDRREIESANFRAWQDLEGFAGVEELAQVELSLRNQEEGAIGYVEPIDKMQIRYTCFIDTPEGRKLSIQTAFISGVKMDTEFMNRFLRHIGHIEQDETLDRTQILGRPKVVNRSEIRDPVDMVRLMDDFYALETGIETIFGVRADLRPDLAYETVRDLSKEHLPIVKRAIADIDAYALNLVRRGISYEVAEIMLDDYQKYWALTICREDPQLARTVFNNDTYEALLKVQHLEALNSAEAAEEAFATAFAFAPSLMGCGATCRLETASMAEKAKAYARGMKEYKESGEMYVDKGARCPRCGVRGMLRGEKSVMCLNDQCDVAKVGNRVDEGKAKKEELAEKPEVKQTQYAVVHQEFEDNQQARIEELQTHNEEVPQELKQYTVAA